MNGKLNIRFAENKENKNINNDKIIDITPEKKFKDEDDEEYIFHRLEREKRCGNVERINNNTAKFSCDVFDSSELVPWIRTFICRITDISFSNRNIEKRFILDLDWMYEQYDI